MVKVIIIYKVYLLIGNLLSLLLLYTHYSPKSEVFLIIFIKFYTFLINYLLAYKQHLKRHHFGQDIEFAAKISIKRFFCCPKITKNEFCKVEFAKSSTKVNINLTICWTLRSNNFNIVCSVAQKKNASPNKREMRFLHYVLCDVTVCCSSEQRG